jgi:hypothetical protein
MKRKKGGGKRYRTLRYGEALKVGDEVFDNDGLSGRWEPVPANAYGVRVRMFIGHYRRPISTKAKRK